jgi:hypothetical protein
MFHLKNITKSPLISKELTRVLPIAVSNHGSARSYSGHQIPERLQHIPTAANPKFFDMVIYINCVLIFSIRYIK